MGRFLDEALRQKTRRATIGTDVDVQAAASALLALLASGPPRGVSPAVSAFQSAYNAAGNSPALAVDGLWGPNTEAALGRYGQVPQPPPFGSLGPASPGELLPSVPAAFPKFTTALEGNLGYLYQDERGLVTTGWGNLVDPLPAALALPWTIGGRPATTAEVTAAWNAVKNNQNPAWYSTGAVNIPGNNVQLSDAAVTKLAMGKLAEMSRTLTSLFPNVLSWPADAQLGLLGVAWATGPNLTSIAYMAPFVSAVKSNDFATMASTAHWGNIAANRKAALTLLFQNAAKVASDAGDFTLLNWPARLTARMALRGVATYAEASLAIFFAGGLVLGTVGWILATVRK